MNGRLNAVATLRDALLTAPERKRIRDEILEDWATVCPIIRDDLRKADEATVLTMLDLIAGSRDCGCFDAVLGVALSKAPERVRQTAAIALGKVDGSEAFEALVGLLTDASAAVRLGAIHGLWALGDPRAAGPLGLVLKDTTRVRAWWPGSKAGGYEVGEEAALAIQSLEEGT
jgi:HEAT repeat protein